jgi:crotonobetainyl-CoA:carnitine CoA-transferase CaiB-like acyl-CoA transferase
MICKAAPERNPMAGPLVGVRVVELGVWVAGPAAGGILADWGADVVKIEPPDGDPARMFGRMLGIEDGSSPPFEMDNRGKRSIVLDVTTEDDRATARELLCGADVFLTNVRPAALARVGLDFEAVAAANPALVYGLTPTVPPSTSPRSGHDRALRTC